MPPKKPRREWTNWAKDTSYKTHEGSYAAQLEGQQQEGGGGEDGPKLGKRKVAMVVGYCGTGFQGWQMNKGVRSIEAEVEHAIYRANLISASNFGNLNKINWSKSARTDKGVHAAAQIVACKLCIRDPRAGEDDDGAATSSKPEGGGSKKKEEGKEEEGGATTTTKEEEGGASTTTSSKQEGKEEEGGGVEEEEVCETNMVGVMEAINAHLPPAIRILDMVRVSKPFDARKMCDKRRYVYLLPTFVLMDVDEAKAVVSDCVPPEGGSGSGEGGKKEEEMAVGEGDEEEKKRSGGEGEGAMEGDGYEPPDPAKLPGSFERFKPYRVTPERLQAFRAALRLFVGNKRFHNFSSRVDPKSSQAWRILLSVEAGEPWVGEDGVEWVGVTLEGVSFLLNMIRKIIAAAVDVARGAVTETNLLPAFDGSTRMIVPMAPADGLYLRKAIYEQYDSRQPQHATGPDRRVLDWERDDAARQRVEAFENQHIRPHILSKESESQPFTRWLYNLSFGSQGAYAATPIAPSDEQQQKNRGEKRGNWGGRKGGGQQDGGGEEVEE